jgi:hypothetical protein
LRLCQVPVFAFFGKNFHEYSLDHRTTEPKKFPLSIHLPSHALDNNYNNNNNNNNNNKSDNDKQNSGHGKVKNSNDEDQSRDVKSTSSDVSGDVMRVSYVGQFSNFATRHDGAYVLRFALQDPHYNFYIMHTDKGDFSSIGLQGPLFTAGVFRVRGQGC